MYLLFCPCIRDPALRAVGITHDRDREAYERALTRCRINTIPVRYLPCPETRYLGRDREPATYAERLDTHQFSRVLGECEQEIRRMIANYGPPSLIVGVDASPTCGVTRNWKSPSGREEGRGAFLIRFPEIPAYDVYNAAMYRVYLASPLFSEAERAWNLRIAALLRSYAYEVYLPQEIGDTEAARGDDVHQEIFRANHTALDAADLVVAVIDGADADSGTSWEIGYAYAKGIPVIAIRTDFRNVGDHEQVNLMLEQSARVVRTLDDLILHLPCPIPISGLSARNEQQ